MQQFMEYRHWVEAAATRHGNPTSPDPLAAVLSLSSSSGNLAELGYCFGLNPTLTVASAHDRAEFQKYSSVAMPLSVYFGALINAIDIWNTAQGKSGCVSIATAWVGPKQEDGVRRIVSSLFPDAYQVVLYDESRATVKTTEQTAPLLQKRLRAAGVIAIKMDIGGHNHNPHPDVRGATDRLVALGASDKGLEYADIASLALPTFDNHGAGRRVGGDHPYELTELVLRSLFTQQCQWY